MLMLMIPPQSDRCPLHRAARRQGAAALIAAALALVLAACSAAPASPNLSTAATTAERQGRFDCNITRQRMTALANSMNGLDALAKVQAESLPTTAVATFQRLTGPRGSGIPAVIQFEAEKARYDALAASARQNGCGIADIDKVYEGAVKKMQAVRG